MCKASNGRELSGTPDERRKHLTLGPRGVGRSRESGVRSNSLLGGAQRRLILTTSGNNDLLCAATFQVAPAARVIAFSGHVHLVSRQMQKTAANEFFG
jgi:hypothetical protein